MMRSGTVVGSFKIDLKTVYDALGRYTYKDEIFCLSSSFLACSVPHSTLALFGQQYFL